MMNITLYKAAEELQALLDDIDPETGEIVGDLQSARDLVASKAVATVAYLKDTDAKVAYLRAAAKDLEARAKAQEKRNAWLRQYLAANMAATGITHIKDDTGLFEAKLERERDLSVDVFEPDLVPEEYTRTKPAEQEPDKKLIKSALDSGIDVPGARIIKKDRLTIK